VCELAVKGNIAIHILVLFTNNLTPLRKADQKCLESFEPGAGEVWRRSVGSIVREMKKCYVESRRRGISYLRLIEG
jgi:hypothetical protein